MSTTYTLRLRWVSWWYRHVFARLSGQARIIHANLERAFPGKTPAERRTLEAKVLANVGRGYGELSMLDRFLPTLEGLDIHGPGRDVLLKAVADKRPAILVTGHIGNYVAGLGVLGHLGIDAGFMYRTRGTRFLDRRFDRVLKKLGPRGFKISHRKDRKMETNLRHFIEFLGQGKVVVMLADHRDKRGPALEFLGESAPTSLTPAKLALAHDAVMIPSFVLRKGGSGRFHVLLEDPVKPGDEADMMQDFNDVISDVIMNDPAQWSWTIRRW